MTGDWRRFRPAIWLAMFGIALALLVNPPYIGVGVIGGAIGIGLRIRFARRPVDRAHRQATQNRHAGQGGRRKGQRGGPKRPS